MYKQCLAMKKTRKNSQITRVKNVTLIRVVKMILIGTIRR
jgi:hypothetical protein